MEFKGKKCMGGEANGGGGQKVGHLVCSCNGQRSLKIGEKIMSQ